MVLCKGEIMKLCIFPLQAISVSRSALVCSFYEVPKIRVRSLSTHLDQATETFVWHTRLLVVQCGGDSDICLKERRHSIPMG